MKSILYTAVTLFLFVISFGCVSKNSTESKLSPKMQDQYYYEFYNSFKDANNQKEQLIKDKKNLTNNKLIDEIDTSLYKKINSILKKGFIFDFFINPGTYDFLEGYSFIHFCTLNQFHKTAKLLSKYSNNNNLMNIITFGSLNDIKKIWEKYNPDTLNSQLSNYNYGVTVALLAGWKKGKDIKIYDFISKNHVDFLRDYACSYDRIADFAKHLIDINELVVFEKLINDLIIKMSIKDNEFLFETVLNGILNSDSTESINIIIKNSFIDPKNTFSLYRKLVLMNKIDLIEQIKSRYPINTSISDPYNANLLFYVNSTKMAEYLIKEGVLLNLRNKNNENAIYYIIKNYKAEKGIDEIIKLLLDKGAELVSQSNRNNVNEKIYYYSLINGHNNIASIIVDKYFGKFKTLPLSIIIKDDLQALKKHEETKSDVFYTFSNNEEILNNPCLSYIIHFNSQNILKHIIERSDLYFPNKEYNKKIKLGLSEFLKDYDYYKYAEVSPFVFSILSKNISVMKEIRKITDLSTEIITDYYLVNDNIMDLDNYYYNEYRNEKFSFFEFITDSEIEKEIVNFINISDSNPELESDPSLTSLYILTEELRNRMIDINESALLLEKYNSGNTWNDEAERLYNEVYKFRTSSRPIKDFLEKNFYNNQIVKDFFLSNKDLIDYTLGEF